MQSPGAEPGTGVWTAQNTNMKQFRNTELWITEDGQVWNERLQRFLMHGYDKDKYPYIAWGRRIWIIHQLVCEAYHGPKPTKKHEVRHIDGTKNNHYTNLCWGTKKENAEDRKKHGRDRGGSYPGDRNPRATITNEQAIEIYKMFHIGKKTMNEIANTLKLDYGLINALVRGKSWSKITKGCLNE